MIPKERLEEIAKNIDLEYACDISEGILMARELLALRNVAKASEELNKCIWIGTWKDPVSVHRDNLTAAMKAWKEITKGEMNETR